MRIKYSKLREVKHPEKGTSLSAGLDLFIPAFNDSFIKDFELKNTNDKDKILLRRNKHEILIYPHQSICIPSGLCFEMDSSVFLMLANRSSVSFKKHLAKLAEIIDSDYQGEVHIVLHNYSNEIISIKENEKIAQLVVMKNYMVQFVNTNITDMYCKQSERGKGGFGSTNKFRGE